MTIAAVLVVAGFLGLVGVWLALRGYSGVTTTDDLAVHTRPVDLPAFKNLIDARDDEYLRTHLSRGDFRAAQRLRVRAAMEYVMWTAHNAAVLLRMGEAAAKSSDLAIAQRGRQLANTAISVRLNCFSALIKLSLSLVFPGTQLPAAAVLEKYATLRTAAVLLTSFQHPTSVSKVASAI